VVANNDMNIEKTYIYANSQIMAQHLGDHTTSRYFYLHDRLGSVRQIIDTSGGIVNHYTYGPFGRMIEDSSDEPPATSNCFMFTGQYHDSEIDQYYLRARQYDPYISRFTTRDPVFGQVQQPLTLHVYLYSANDPINRIDPWGLDSVALYDPESSVNWKNAADDFDWWAPVRNMDQALFWVGTLRDMGVEIDDLYMFDHGSPGAQSVGDDVLYARATSKPLARRESRLPEKVRRKRENERAQMAIKWQEFAGYVEEKGAVHLRGCAVAGGNAGKNYIMDLANTGRRRVTAFDAFINVFDYEKPGLDYYFSGNLYMAAPNRGYSIISEAKWYHKYGWGRNARP